MNEMQRTLNNEVQLAGIGLHTGAQTTITIKPSEADTWFVFKRVDLEGSPEVKADADFVSHTQRGTSLKKGETEVHTTEHLLAALYGMGYDNAIIELDGPEIPILDGSAMPFVAALKKAGYKEQDSPRNYFVLEENMKFINEDRQAEFLAVPDPEHRVTVMVDYHSPLLGTQHASMYQLGEFEKEIAPCRTFVFLRELMQLVNAGLIKGGSVNNAIVMVDTELSDAEKQKLADTFNKPTDMLDAVGIGILNNLELHYENEPARHKLLDILGDLALIGQPIKGHILAARPGHQTNIEFAKELKKQIKLQKTRAPRFDVNVPPIKSILDVKKTLPHRYPMLLVDKVVDLVVNDYVVAVKNVTSNEDMFNGHFPEEPIMPGVLIVEAMAQSGGFLVLAGVEDPENYSTYFLKVDKVKFKQKVVPGDQLVMRVHLTQPVRRGVGYMKGVAYVGDKVVCEGELIAQIIKNKS